MEPSGRSRRLSPTLLLLVYLVLTKPFFFFFFFFFLIDDNELNKKKIFKHEAYEKKRQKQNKKETPLSLLEWVFTPLECSHNHFKEWNILFVQLIVAYLHPMMVGDFPNWEIYNPLYVNC